MVALGSILQLFCFYECCSKYWIPNNITELGLRLKNQVIGQPLVHDIILNSISSHVFNTIPSKALVLSLHGSTGTGKNFVAKHIVESLYRKGFHSKYVKLYVVSRDFMHNDTAHISEYKDRITKDIEEKTKKCPQAIFIFDEIEQMPNELLTVLSFYIDFHIPTMSQPIDFRKTIFIFLSNSGGTALIEQTTKNHLSSIKREDYNILEFEKVLSNASFYEQGGLQYAPLIEKELITYFVPFLPLQREHIRGCIKRELQIHLDNDQYEYEYSENDIIDGVLNLIQFDSLTSLKYSLSGCKKVPQKLSFIFETIRPTLKKRKKITDL